MNDYEHDMIRIRYVRKYVYAYVSRQDYVDVLSTILVPP